MRPGRLPENHPDEIAARNALRAKLSPEAEKARAEEERRRNPPVQTRPTRRARGWR